jgi:hypothetical protein
MNAAFLPCTVTCGRAGGLEPCFADLEQISLGSNREDSQGFINERVCRH